MFACIKQTEVQASFHLPALLLAGVLASDLSKDRLRCGSLAYWAMILSVIPFVLLISAAVRLHLVRNYRAKLAANYDWVDGDVMWNERNTLVYPSVCSLAGLVAGMFGVGGGIVKVRCCATAGVHGRASRGS